MKIKPLHINIEGCPKKYEKVLKQELCKSLNKDKEFERKMNAVADRLLREILYGKSSTQ